MKWGDAVQKSNKVLVYIEVVVKEQRTFTQGNIAEKNALFNPESAVIVSEVINYINAEQLCSYVVLNCLQAGPVDERQILKKLFFFDIFSNKTSKKKIHL